MGFEYADFLLQFLDVHYGLLEDLEFELFFLPLLPDLGRLLLRNYFVIFVIVVYALIARNDRLPSGIGRDEISKHRECLIDLGAPGLLDAGMILAAHRFTRST